MEIQEVSHTPSSGDTKREKSSGERLLFLDGLRGLLALLVYIDHVNQMSGRAFGHSGIIAGDYRVAAFFALAGFVQYLSSAHLDTIQLKMPYREFAKRRALRLIPAYMVAILLSAVVQFRFSGLDFRTFITGEYGTALVTHLGMVQSWQSADIKILLNGAVWMLTYEWVYTLTLPLLLATVRRFGWHIPFLGLGLLFLLPASSWTWGILAPGYFLGFVSGVAAARIARRMPRHGKILRIISLEQFCLGISVLMFGAYLVGYSTNPGVDWNGFASIYWKNSLGHIAIGLSFAALCLHMTYAPEGVVARLFSSRPMALVGIVSYSLFLFHLPILQCQRQLFIRWGWTNHVPLWLLFLLAFPTVLAIVTLSFRFLEEPFMRSRSSQQSSSSSPEINVPTAS